MARGRGIKLDIKGLDEMIDALDRGANEFREVLHATLKGDAGQIIVREVRSRIRSRQGNLADSVDVRGEIGQGVEIGADDRQSGTGTIIESGSRAHTIEAGRGRALLIAGGQPVTRVEHPGTRAQRVMDRSIAYAQVDVEIAIVEEFERRGVAQP